MISVKDVYFLENFKNIPGLVHGISTKIFGGMKKGDRKTLTDFEVFADRLNIGAEDIVGMNQVHGRSVTWVGDREKGHILKRTDGLLSTKKNVFLCATAADCLPILFYDTQMGYFGAAHAGWKGLLLEIPVVMIKEFVKKGSDPSNIVVGIGPSIGVCCYEVDGERAVLFTKQFKDAGEEFVIERNGRTFLDLQKLAVWQLTQSGVQQKQIEVVNLCTADNNELFYSYRKGDKDCFAAIIGRV